MSLKRLVRSLVHRAVRLLPRRWRPRTLDPGRRVAELSAEQRALLRENLRRLVHPKAA